MTILMNQFWNEEPLKATWWIQAVNFLKYLSVIGGLYITRNQVRLESIVTERRLQRLAIANPAHAPYGARAREALTHVGLWPAIEPRLVIGENISQAAQFASTGAAQGGIIALSLAMAPALAALGRFELIPEGFHKPLVQRMVLIKGAPPAAVAFHAYLAQPQAQQVMVRFGFTRPAGVR